MKHAYTLQVALPSDRELALSRSFDAPRSLVFTAHSEPDLVRRWLTGPAGWIMSHCEIDFKVDGSYRYEWRQADGTQMGLGGKFREILANQRIVSTEVFDQPWYPGSATGTLDLIEDAGQTRLTYTMQYDSREIRDGVNQPSMQQGIAGSYDRLAELLKTM